MATTTELKAMPRFGTLSSPSSYRPSYSGGTYRSAGIKREPAPVSSYTSRYSTLSASKEAKEKDAAPVKKLTSTSPSIKFGSSKDVSSSETKPVTSRYSSTGNLAASKLKPKEAISDRRPGITVTRVKSRDPSPIRTKTYGRRSRDPSPSEPAKDCFASTTNGYVSSMSRLYPRGASSSSTYSSKFGGSNTSLSSRGSSTALSYMNANEAAIRTTRRRLAKEETSKSSSLERQKEKSKEKDEPDKLVENKVADTVPEETIELTVVTRATSPTPPTANNYLRTRRLEVAKTVEKVIQRPVNRPKLDDKEVQSDRLDDTSKYCRFNGTRATSVPSWSNYLDSKYSNNGYSRFNNSSSTSSRYRTNKSDKEKSDSDSPEKSPEKVTTNSKSRDNSISRSPCLSRRNSIKSNARTEKSKSKSPPTPGLKNQARLRQKTNGVRALPPPAPKESLSRTTSSSNSPATYSNSKWANKDFRKSALNVGPTDRPRKNRTSSADSDESSRESNQSHKSVSPCLQTERSSSVSSEVSTSSATTSSNADDMSKTFGKLKISASSPVSNGHDVRTENDVSTASSKGSKQQSPISEQQRRPPQQQQPIRQRHNDSSLSVSPPTPPPRGEESKSCLVRALGPVSNLFKSKSYKNVVESELQPLLGNNSTTMANLNEEATVVAQQPAVYQFDADTATTTANVTNLNDENTDDTSWWLNSIPLDATTVDQTLACNGTNMKNKLRHIDSGELPWWMNENDNEIDGDDDTVAEDITLNQSEAMPTITIGGSNPCDSEWLGHTDTSSEVGWWQMQDDSNLGAKKLTNESKMSDESRSAYKISHIRSGERAWWMDNNNNNQKSSLRDDGVQSEKTNSTSLGINIKRIESGERSWWMANSDETGKLAHNHNSVQHTDYNQNNILEDDENDWWAKLNTDAAKIPSKISNRGCVESKRLSTGANLDYSPMPLGDRASPEGLEDLHKELISPYDNIHGGKKHPKQKDVKKLFISRHQNIDDLLGGSCHTFSPLLLEQFSGDVFQEITPAQVRIHDSTAKMPFIHRMSEDR